MFSNLVQRLTEGGFLTDGMSRPQGADLDVAGIIGSLPTFRSLERNRSGGLFGPARSLMGAMLESNGAQGMTGVSRQSETQRQSRPPSNFLEVLQQSPMFGDAFRGLANGGLAQGMGSSQQGQQGQQQPSGIRAPGARSVGLF